MYPKNAWYVACTPADIDEKPLGRTVCGERIVFFRGPEGQAVGLEDWCPHRGAPLSLGRVVEGKLVCGYHGLEMGCEGKTLAMPGQRVRGFPPVATYPVIERYGFVWVWPGDAGRADPALLPNLAWAEDPAWAFGGGMFHVKCDYRLMIDNLMDLTHEKYVHSTSIGQQELDEVPAQTTAEGDVVITRREMPGVKAPPFWQAAMRGNGHDDQATVDRWQRCRFVPPSSVLIDVGVALAGQGGFEAPAAAKTSGIVVDLITPETETSIWYFWGLARNFRPEDKALTASIREAQGKVFMEDLEMLESQQRNLLARPERKLLSLNTDLGGVQARRIIDRLVEQEKGHVMSGATLTVRVARKSVEAEGICSFDLVGTDGAPLPAFSAGSHVDVQLPGGLTRQYSLCNDPTETHRYLIAVLRDPASRGGSLAMHEAVKEGDTLTISTPKNHFALAHEAGSHLLLAGGIGITPLLCMAERLANVGAAFEMHYCTRSRPRTAFVERIARSAFAQRVQFHHDDGPAEQRLDIASLLAERPAGRHLYVCGPKGFMDAVLGAARAQGWPESQLHYEFFSAEVAPVAGDASFEVQLASSGRIVVVPANRSIVQALADAGVTVATSCEQGVCGTCLTRVIEGVPEHRDLYLTPEEQAAGDQFLPCCSRARSARLVLDL